MEQKVAISCVWCGKPMEKGFLASRSPSMFLPEDTELPKLLFKKNIEASNCIPLKPMHGSINLEGQDGFYDHFEIAYACRDCKKIVIPYSFE